MDRKQRTIRNSFEVEGVGLHEGEKVRVFVRPGRPDSGVLFIRTDEPDSDPIPAHYRSVVDAHRRTTLGVADGPRVHTVEHLLAALHACGVDNVEVELDQAELPGLDGSAKPWFDQLQSAGIVDQKVPVKTFVIEQPVSVELDGASISAFPSSEDGLHLSYTLDYRNFGLEPQYVELDLPGTDVANELAPARTFVFASEVEGLKEAGLGKGADASNTVILEDGAKLGSQNDQLRFPDEPARHKIMDLLGDLFLVGAQIQGRVVAVKSGHRVHHELLRLLVDEMEEQETAGRVLRESGMDIREITRLLPHRYPFLLVDRVLELEGYRRAVGIKNVTVNEPFFSGHFPDQPIMPGVLILEALAQLAGTLLLRRMEYTGKLPVLWAIDKVKLRRSVVPGDQLRLEVEATKVRDTMGRVDCIAKVNEHIAAEAQMVFTLVEAG
ncbi:MAG: UDP-3-O-acyl-N-acetylglucosamine deacetylase [Planctomycetota bacterium]|nr:UDP-3-O-acyl-N-acetylglucosamine deacetylase [Planctomycetota bacterium]